MSYGNSESSVASSESVDTGGAVDGNKPPSWWFTFPADPRWQV